MLHLSHPKKETEQRENRAIESCSTMLKDWIWSEWTFISIYPLHQLLTCESSNPRSFLPPSVGQSGDLTGYNFIGGQGKECTFAEGKRQIASI